MEIRTPITVITGPLGSGKTTLLRHILDSVSGNLAILMNEFGEIAIDSQIIEGKNIRMTELGGGCVCCSLAGEFEAAVNEIIETIKPDAIVLETTGVAEPDALVFDIQEELTSVRLDGVVSAIDADGLVKYPQIGHTTRMQIEGADLILLNKVDLVTEPQRRELEAKLQEINDLAPIIPTERCQVDPNLLFGIYRNRIQPPPHHVHQPEFDSFSYRGEAVFNRQCFEEFADRLDSEVYRAKGFIRFPEGTFLFNFVAGRWELESFSPQPTQLVFIGKQLRDRQTEIIHGLTACEQSSMSYEFLEEMATADIAFRAVGEDLVSLFKSAWDATMNAMIENLQAISPQETRSFSLENEALDMLLFNFLQELIYYKDSEQLLLRPQQVKIEENAGGYHLQAVTAGETLDPDRHEQRVDVKAVTLHQFEVKKTDTGWMAIAILDI
jgi:G3E family GTPase/SHS2 domain-containing protein